MQLLVMSCSVIMTALRFTCGEKKIWSNIKHSQNIMAMIFCNFFVLIFMSLLLFLIVKNNHNLAGTYFILLKIHTRRNFKGFQYQIWTSVKRSEKQLSSKTNFSTFLYFLVSSSNFRLKLC